MPLRKITLESYRCFDARTELELRPITIVLGRNNSGKSALVRAPMVIEKGIRTDSSEPIDLDALDDEIVESFTDLIYGHRPHGSITVGLELDASPGYVSETLLGSAADPPEETYPRSVSIAATIQHIDEYDRQVVSSLKIDYAGSSLTLRWNQEDPGASDLFQYSVKDSNIHYDDVGPIPVSFSGLLPRGSRFWDYDSSIGAAQEYSVAQIFMNYPVIRYFGPFRDRPVRRFRSPTGMPQSLGSSGENAGRVLAADYVRRGGQLLAEVNNVLAKDLPGWTVDLSEQGGMYAVVLRSREDPALDVNLADAGTGVAQVLPIFVQRALDVLNPPDDPVLEIVEQPELHLHPAAHGGLADLYLTAAQRGNVQFLIETHSETLLLRLRRRIAEGTVDPDAVALYFVEHDQGRATARRINIGPDGGLDYWPDGVFSEDYEEARALANAQLEGRDRRAR